MGCADFDTVGSIMAANPQGFFCLAARYYPLLLDLFYLREGLTEADLRHLIVSPINRSGTF